MDNQIELKSGLSTNVATATTNSELTVALSQNTHTGGTIYNPGYLSIQNETFVGSAIGSFQSRAKEISVDDKLRTSPSNLFYNEVFSYSGQNTSSWGYSSNTLSVVWSSPYMYINGSGSTLSGSVVASTYRYFPILGASSLDWESSISFSNAYIPINFQFNYGLFTHSPSPPFAVVDGAYFSLSQSGLSAVTVYNSTGITASTSFLTYSAVSSGSTFYKIIIDQRYVTFLVNNIPYAIFNFYGKNGNLLPTMATSLPISYSVIQNGSTDGVCMPQIGSCNVKIEGWDMKKDWSAQMSGLGLNPYQSTPGTLQGAAGALSASTGQFVNNTNPLVFSPSGSSLSASSVGFGGIYNVAIGASGLIQTYDYVIDAFQNPLPTSATTARSLYIYGVKIDSVIMPDAFTALVNPVSWLTDLCFGSTASLLTTSETATSKQPRIVPLGVQTLLSGTTGSTQATPTISTTFSSPIIINPGEYVQIGVRFITTQSTVFNADQALWFYITYDGFYE